MPVSMHRRSLVNGFACTCMLAVCFCGCSRPVEKVHFVVPSGFRGPIAIIPDQQDGIRLQRENGGYRIPIPENGTLRIQPPDPFRHYLLSASFQDGRPIPVLEKSESTTPGRIVLWQMYSQVRATGTVRERAPEAGGGTEFSEKRFPCTYVWFVGTEIEMKDFLAKD